MLKLDKIEIIGFNNFIGFHLAKYFLEQGIEVTAYKIPLEEDSFPFKKMELGRSANLTIKDLAEANLEEKVIVDLYGLDNKQSLMLIIKENIKEADYLILSDEKVNLEGCSNVIELPIIFGPWDYVKDEEILRDNSSVIGITDVCIFIEDKIMNKEVATIEELPRTNFKNDYLERKNWIERYKKSK